MRSEGIGRQGVMSRLERAPLAEVCTIAMGQAPKGVSYNSQGIGYPLIAGAGDFGVTTPFPEKWTGSPTKLSEPGDIIICIRATIGDLNWSDKPYCLGRGVAGLRPLEERLDVNYLWHYLKRSSNELRSKARGATFLQVSKADISSMEIPLPPLSEQKRIAAILDAADALRAKRRETLAELDRLLQSTFLDMFGDPVTNPKRLLRCRLGDQITLQRGRDITAKEASPGRVPVISSGGVSFYHNVPLIAGPGVLLGRKGSVGKVHYSSVDYWPHDTTLFVKDFKGNDPRFVYFFFLRFPISHYEASAANPSLNRNNLHPVEVAWPDLGLQQQFAAIVESAERQKARLREHLTELDTLFASLQARAFTGEL